MKSVILCGVGGQGTVLAAKLIAQCALDKGLQVRSTETIGMAQRGGSVVSHVRIAETPEEQVFSPMVPKGDADIIIGFEPGEVTRNLDYLKPGGTVVVAQQAVAPITAALSRDNYDGRSALGYLYGLADDGFGEPDISTLVVIDGNQACKEVGSAKVLNVVLLGAACATGALGFDCSTMENALVQLVKQQFVEMNRTALKTGADLVDVTARRW